MYWLWGDTGTDFYFFSQSHITMIVLLIILAIALVLFRNQVRAVTTRKVEIVVAVILLLLEFGYYAWLVTSDDWHISTSLPLELCSITLYSAIFFLLSGWKPAGVFIYYAGIAGALQAIVTPVLFVDFPHFRFFHFFLVHTGIILIALYGVTVKNVVPTYRNAILSFATLLSIAFVVIIVNRQTSGNYMFLQQKPASTSLLDVLGPYPTYIFSLSILALFLFMSLATLYKIVQPKKVVSYEQ